MADYRTKPKPESAFISIGGGLKFVTEDYFVRELAPLGTTKRGFRALCRAIHVPMLRFGRTWLVELMAFEQGMRAASRPGQPDFLAPGSDLKGTKAAEGTIDKLDPDKLREQQADILNELVLIRRAKRLPTTAKTKKALKEAARRVKKMADERKGEVTGSEPPPLPLVTAPVSTDKDMGLFDGLSS